MAMVVIQCPKTGKEVNTGVDLDSVSFEAAPLTNNKFQCPVCGEFHTWDKKDAKLKR